ncbi:Rid family hydrolase [Actinotalea solisilvae]|uniref:Rid family hydrolase n=1 Tax=Actinotalea solisilvae TaxID=2072922 RepID=UPI0018F20041|nr:Rid family hydrolase [Actinotalea solisilvae]
MDTITLLRPDGLVSSPAFSHVAVVPPGATTIHVGGQNAVDATGALVGGDDVAAQTRRVMENVATALAAAGATLADVVSWTILFAQGVDVGAAYAAAAPSLAREGAPPLVTAAVVSGLAVPGALVEASAVAAVVR